jgi:hypothetical protein
MNDHPTDAYNARIKRLPEPLRSAARANQADAEQSIEKWPGLTDQILEDLDQAISHWESVAEIGITILEITGSNNEPIKLAEMPKMP